MEPLYNCGQQELYSVCRMAWDSCSEQLTTFSAHKAFYTPSFIATKMAAINAASLVPSTPAVKGGNKDKRIDLTKDRRVCTKLFTKLVSYMNSAYTDPDILNARMIEAGQGHYNGATNNNWESVEALNTDARLFITNRLSELTAGANMPIAFQATFEMACDTYSAQHTLFLNSGKVLPVGTQDKVEANNGIYLDLKVMLEDGQILFEENKAVKRQFVFSRLLYLVTGAGTSGIKGYVVDSVTDLPIEGVEISIPPKRRKVMTDNEGHYSYLKVAAGHYKVKFTKEGYQPVVLEDFEVKLGTTTMLNQIMVPIVQTDDDNES